MNENSGKLWMKMAILQEGLQYTLSFRLEEYLWKINHLKADHLGSVR